MRLFVNLILVTLIAGCSKSSDNSPEGVIVKRPPEMQSTEVIEEGVDIVFFCRDSFNNSDILIIADWKKENLKWEVSIHDNSEPGEPVLQQNGLVGVKDQFLNAINISDEKSDYAVIRQIDKRLAQYKDGDRIMECSF